jgi:hypothetical protein
MMPAASATSVSIEVKKCRAALGGGAFDAPGRSGAGLMGGGRDAVGLDAGGLVTIVCLLNSV